MVYERIETDPNQVCPVDAAHGNMVIHFQNDKFIELYRKRIAELADCACDDCSSGHDCGCNK
jgi:hypothetical protein